MQNLHLSGISLMAADTTQNGLKDHVSLVSHSE